MDFAAQVRSSLKAGHTPDQVAQALMHDSGLLPISAIKALRSGGDMTLVEAKEVIQRNLSAEQWAATKELWEMIAGGDDV
jgi:ribosomal protein L7/L12